MKSSLLLQLLALLYTVSLVLCNDANSIMESKLKIARPESFASRAELEDYLKELRDYYAILGRPRFGRSAPSPRDFRSSLDDTEYAKSRRSQHLADRLRRTLRAALYA